MYIWWYYTYSKIICAPLKTLHYPKSHRPSGGHNGRVCTKSIALAARLCERATPSAHLLWPPRSARHIWSTHLVGRFVAMLRCISLFVCCVFLFHYESDKTENLLCAHIKYTPDSRLYNVFIYQWARAIVLMHIALIIQRLHWPCSISCGKYMLVFEAYRQTLLVLCRLFNCQWSRHECLSGFQECRVIWHVITVCTHTHITATMHANTLEKIHCGSIPV